MTSDTPRPTQEELNALPESIQRYIAALEADVRASQQAVQNNEDELRRKRYAYWGRR